jgi:hypothetical protein
MLLVLGCVKQLGGVDERHVVGVNQHNLVHYTQQLTTQNPYKFYMSAFNQRCHSLATASRIVTILGCSTAYVCFRPGSHGATSPL